MIFNKFTKLLSNIIVFYWWICSNILDYRVFPRYLLLFWWISLRLLHIYTKSSQKTHCFYIFYLKHTDRCSTYKLIRDFDQPVFTKINVIFNIRLILHWFIYSNGRKQADCIMPEKMKTSQNAYIFYIFKWKYTCFSSK